VTITINAEAEQERRLTARARQHGVPVEQYILHLVEEDLTPQERVDAFPQTQSAANDAWFEELKDLAASALQTPYIPQEALRRENLYEDRA
jgi:hypothetical protein